MIFDCKKKLETHNIVEHFQFKKEKGKKTDEQKVEKKIESNSEKKQIEVIVDLQMINELLLSLKNYQLKEIVKLDEAH